MFGNDNATYGFTNNSSASWPPVDIHAMAEMMRRFKVKDDLRKSRAFFEILQIEPCRECGERVEYKERPHEHYVMCGHMLAELKRQFPPPENVTGRPAPYPDLNGMTIYRK